MTIMKGWRDRQEAARIRMEAKLVDPEIRAQRQKAIDEAKAATARASEVYDNPPEAIVESDEGPAQSNDDGQNDGQPNDGEQQPAAPQGGKKGGKGKKEPAQDSEGALLDE